MGCGLSRRLSRTVRVEDARRRLSIGIVEDEGDTIDEPIGREEDRCMLLQLSQQQLMQTIDEFVAKGNGRKFSVASETDKQLNGVSPFSSKEMKLEGEMDTPSQECIGYVCKKGLKPEAPNQDSFFVARVEDSFALYGVFDGHGRKGHDVSNFVKDHLPKILITKADILNDPINSLKKTFEQTQKLIEQATSMKKIDANRSGTTASVVLHDIAKSTLYIAHVGDSRCVLGTKETDTWQATDLTEDHKPNHPHERARIEKAGGQVLFDGGYNYRVYAKGKRYPGLNMSRAMGDLVGFYDAGISAMPDVATQGLENDCNNPNVVKNAPKCPIAPIDPNTAIIKDTPSSEKKASKEPTCSPSVSTHSISPLRQSFLLVCSDGIWEFVNSEEAVELVGQFARENAMKAAEQLSVTAWDRWMTNMRGEVVDDITALVIHLPYTAISASDT